MNLMFLRHLKIILKCGNIDIVVPAPSGTLLETASESAAALSAALEVLFAFLAFFFFEDLASSLGAATVEVQARCKNHRISTHIFTYINKVHAYLWRLLRSAHFHSLVLHPFRRAMYQDLRVLSSEVAPALSWTNSVEQVSLVVL